MFSALPPTRFSCPNSLPPPPSLPFAFGWVQRTLERRDRGMACFGRVRFPAADSLARLTQAQHQNGHHQPGWALPHQLHPPVHLVEGARLHYSLAPRPCYAGRWRAGTWFVPKASNFFPLSRAGPLYAFSSCCCPVFRVAPVRVCGLTRRSRCGHVRQLQAVMLLVGFNARIAAIFQAVLLAMMDVRSAPLRPALPPGCRRR